MAYRGRVLIQLETKLGVTPQETSDDLQNHEIISVQVGKDILMLMRPMWPVLILVS